MGVVTTAIFWSTETAFWVIWHTDLARETGAVLGLAVGYVVKYRLDRRFVFTDARPRRRGVTRPAFRTAELAGWGRYPRRPGPVAAPRDAGEVGGLVGQGGVVAPRQRPRLRRQRHGGGGDARHAAR